jgi:cellulose synthase/poly-beta-1,6-N-acetylglucosamine synthase-like glycosyltransferase
MTGSSVLTAILVFSIAATLYFAVWNTLQIIMGVMASGYLVRHKRRHTRRARALAGHLAAPPLVSIVVPAYNEALTIVDSVRALLALDYESREIVVVNDGSVDDTLAQMTRAFQLVPAPVAFVQSIRTEPVRGVYRSISEPRVVLIDKDNGGCKADATNAGINAASGPLVLIIDADTILEPDAISRAVLPFLEDPAMVAVGANVGIANGCRIDDGGITRVGFPRNWFARFQIVDYMRAFLLFRLACAAVNGVPIISGAFGLFRRDAVLAVGGYDRTAIGEDMDLTLRVQEHYRRRKEPIRITFDPNVRAGRRCRRIGAPCEGSEPGGAAA